MRKTVRKTISFMLVFVMLLSYMSIGSAGLMSFAGLTASAEDKADTAESVLPPPAAENDVAATAETADDLQGLKVLFVTDPNNDDTAVDFIDVDSGNTYYIKIENKSPVTATIKEINSVANLKGFTSGDTIEAGGYAAYELTGITNISETGFSADSTVTIFTLGGVYDFTVTYTLEHVHTSDSTADTTFTQPAYIGAWQTNDDSRNLPKNPVDSREDGYKTENTGLSIYRKINNSHKIDLALDFQVDKGIINQTWYGGNGSVNDAHVHFQLFVDSTDIPDYTLQETGETGKRWQDIGFRMRADSWADDATHLNPTNQSGTTPGAIVLGGNYDNNSVFSFYMENVQDYNSNWSGSQNLTTWTVKSREAISNDGYVAGTGNLVTRRGWNEGSGDGAINKGSSYFPITGFMFKGSNTGIEPATAYFGDYGGVSTHYRLVHTNGGDKGASFQLTMDFYIFDKTELRELVRNTIPAQLSEHYNTSAWGEYKTKLEEAYKALAAQKTTQSAIYDAYTALNDSYTNLKSNITNKVLKVTHKLYNSTRAAGASEYTEYVLVPVNESYTPNHSEYASASNKNNATAHQYTDGNGVEEISVEYWTESTLKIDLNGGLTNDIYQPTETKWLSDTTTLPTVTKDGFTFKGWTETVQGGTLAQSGDTYTYTFNDKDATLTANWMLAEDSVSEDTYVVNFGLPLEIHPTNNDFDIKPIDGESQAVVGIKTFEAADNLAPSNTNNIGEEQSAGAFKLIKGNSIDDTTITYTPNEGSVAGEIEKIVYAVEYTFANGQKTYAYSTVTVVPAANIYYEDNVGLITYKDGKTPTDVDDGNKTGKWQEINDNSLPKIDIDNNTGEEEYNNSADYSMGSAHYVDVSASNNPNPVYCKGTEGNVGSWPYARFTFSGTGFEVISLLSNTTGTVEVKVYKGTVTDGEEPLSEKLESSMLIDSYYGYTFDNGTWTAASGDSDNTLYQIPLIKKTGLTYGTYTVIITPKFSTIFDHANAGSYNFYLDAIRIYDPISTENETVYYTNTEKSLFHGSLRPLIINSEIAGDTDKDTLLGGAWFIDGMSGGGSWDDFVKYGPKNEVYLNAGQAITFQIKTNVVPENISKIKVSMHKLESAPAKVVIGTSAEAKAAPFDVSTATTLYYEIPNDYYSWITDTTGSGWITEKPIVIANNEGGGRLALCDIEVLAQSESNVTNAEISLAVSQTAAESAANVVSLMSTHDMSKGFFIADSISAAPAYSKILRNADSEINVKTSEDVAKVTVNGEEIELAETADGVKSWDYDFTAGKTSGTETFEVVAYSSAGNPTDPLEVTVDVQSRFEQIFDRLHDVIEMIINIFSSIKTE